MGSTPGPAWSGWPTRPTTRSAVWMSKTAMPAGGAFRWADIPARWRSAPTRSGWPTTAKARSPASSREAEIDRIDRGHGAGHRPALHQHDPHALDRRDPEGELRPSRHADGAGPARLHALAALPALRPGRPDLARPRPLRALRRPRLDAALLAALPRRGAGGRPRLRGGRQARDLASRTSNASASSTRARQDTPSTAGPPASRPRPGRSARASRPRSGWRSPESGWRRATAPSCSTSTSTRSAATAA